MIPMPRPPCVHSPQMWEEGTVTGGGEATVTRREQDTRLLCNANGRPSQYMLRPLLGRVGRSPTMCGYYTGPPEAAPGDTSRHKWPSCCVHHLATGSSFPTPVGRLATEAPNYEREGHSHCQFPLERKRPAAMWQGPWWRRLEGVFHCLQLALGTGLSWGQVNETRPLTKAFTCGSCLLLCKGVALERVT